MNSSTTLSRLRSKRAHVARWYATNADSLASDDPALAWHLALLERLDDAIAYLGARVTASRVARLHAAALDR
jgi:hypothetical protein